MKLARLAASPATLYQIASRLGASKLFPASTASFEVTSERSGVFRIEIVEPYQVSASYFAFNAGCLRSFPRLLQLPDAHLNWKVEERTCIYELRYTPSMTVWARVHHAVQYMFNLKSAYEEQRATQEELVRQTHELHKKNEHLRFAHMEAQRKSALEKALLRNVSHELRTPMNGIIGNLEYLKEEVSAEESRSAVDSALDAADRMMKLVANLVNLKAETLTVNSAPIRTQEFLQSLLSSFSLRVTDRDNQMVIRTEPGLPEAFVSDPELIGSALTSLLDNAVKFTSRGTITLHSALLEDRLHFEVKDTGVGMDQETIQRAFDPFAQADNSLLREYEGLGLGVPVAKRCIEALGGRLRVESEPGKGSRFWFDIPYQPLAMPNLVESDSVVPGQNDPKTQMTAAQPLEESGEQGPTVLIVEDNRTNAGLS